MSLPCRRASVLVGVVLAGALVSGCALAPPAGDSERASAAATPTPAAGVVSPSANEADLAYAQAMVIHEEQALEMAEILLDKPELSPRVREIATAVQQVHGPQAERFRAWLHRQGTPVGGERTAPGLLSATEIKALHDADTPAASRRFVEAMVRLNEGARVLSERVVAEGADADLRDLAQAIVTGQQPSTPDLERALAG